jgi:hypothetical protein
LCIFKTGAEHLVVVAEGTVYFKEFRILNSPHSFTLLEKGAEDKNAEGQGASYSFTKYHWSGGIKEGVVCKHVRQCGFFLRYFTDFSIPASKCS